MRTDDLMKSIFGPNAVVEENSSTAGAVDAKVVKGLREITESMLSTLTPRDKEIIKMRFGLNKSGQERSPKEVGAHFNLTPRRIRQIEAKALSKLRHPSRSKRLREFFESTNQPDESEDQSIGLREVIETVKALTPELIIYLQSHETDLEKMDALVFEHLVAEFLKQRGFTDVRLVGKDFNTSADIYAVERPNSLGISTKYFVEVKRHKKKVGIGVINTVFGAMGLEKPRHGWGQGLIISVVGFRKLRNYSRNQLILMGIHLKDESDLQTWLKEYRPANGGLLHLPNPLRKLPKN